MWLAGYLVPEEPSSAGERVEQPAALSVRELVPGGIATYSQAGAQFGLNMLWTMPLAFPLMAAIQSPHRFLGGPDLKNVRSDFVGAKFSLLSLGRIVDGFVGNCRAGHYRRVLASAVEVVEAFTIVLAVATIRGWRPALMGTAAVLGLLMIVVVALGPLLDRVQLHALQLVIGILLLLFGLRWLRKAILRAAGIVALHDEQAAFSAENTNLKDAITRHQPHLDWLAGIAAFKAVVLEGLEVVFIVIAVGAGQGLLIPASLGALAACLLVLLIGVTVHRPLSQVPENTLKFGVGVMLSAFGVFWTGEGLGVRFAWSGFGDPSLRARVSAGRTWPHGTTTCASGGGHMTVLKLIVSEVVGLFIDDEFLAVAIMAVIGVTVVMAFALETPPLIVGAVLLFGCIAVLADSVWRAKRE